MQIKALTTTGFILAFVLGLTQANISMAQMPGMFGGPNMVSQATYMVGQPPGPGMMPGSGMMPGPGMMPGYPQGGQGMVAPVGFFSPSCDSSGCDGCGAAGPGGLIGAVCGSKGNLNGYQNMCPFCQGGGCSLCQSLGNTEGLGALLGALGPYTDAGLCAQRWFDIQAEAIFFSLEGSSTNQVLSSRNPGIATANGVVANTVLSTSDAEFTGIAPGWRLTGSFLFGAGGNIEATYFGSNHFSNSAGVTADLDGGGNSLFNLFSAYSQFGTNPGGVPNATPGFGDDAIGFDDPDRSSRHTIIATSDIHSGEANYRRRWVGPYCRWQGSWLAGFRYFDVDESFIFDARGALNDTQAANVPRFFNSTTQTRNALVGAQLGGDLWWNAYPGINLGIGMKGAIFGNTAEQDTLIRANSLPAGVTQIGESAQGSGTSFLTEIQARGVYRISYAWSLTAAYWFVQVDGLALGAGNVNTAQASQLFLNQPRLLNINMDDSITMHGFSVGTEYLW